MGSKKVDQKFIEIPANNFHWQEFHGSGDVFVDAKHYGSCKRFKNGGHRGSMVIRRIGHKLLES